MSSLSKSPVAFLAGTSIGGFADVKSSNFVPHFGHCVVPGGMGVPHNMQLMSFGSVRV